MEDVRNLLNTFRGRYNQRELTLMGFPDNFIIPVSDTQAYKLFAEAAIVPMVVAVTKCVIVQLPR